MLGFFTFLMTVGVGYAYIMEGLFNGFVMAVNVTLASVLTCSFWELLAGQFEPMFAGTFLAGYEDMLSMILVFVSSLALLRTVSNNLANSQIEFDETAQRVGGAFFGMVTGYLTAGFMVCAMQTLPWHQNFMGFEARYDPQQSFLRSYLPADRVWLGLMRYIGDNGLTNSNHHSFDEGATFELRYERYRRNTEQRGPLPYGGEFETEVHAPSRAGR
jgi:hypothetical protein